MWELVQTLNKSLTENQLNEKVLKTAFDTYWVQFIKEYNEIISSTQPEERVKKRSNEDIIAEILTTVRTIDKKLQMNDILSKRIMAFEEPEQCINPEVIKKITDLYDQTKFQHNKDKLIQYIMTSNNNSDKNKKEMDCFIENYISSKSSK